MTNREVHSHRSWRWVLHHLILALLVIQGGAAGDTLCPGQQVSYNCSDIAAHEWTGSAFNGMCPTADSIALVESDRTEGDVLECGIFTATVTNITTIGLGVMRIDSNLTFTPTTTLPTNGSVVICQDGLQMELERHTINIQGPPPPPSVNFTCDLSGDVSGTVNVTVSWTLSGGDSADFYLINITTNAPQTPYGGLLNITNGNVTQHELTGFMIGYEYNITVRGVTSICGGLVGRESEPLTITLQGPPFVATLSCVELSGDVSGTVNVTVSWTLSGGDSADFYLINITTNAPQTPYGGLLNITTGSVTQHELTGFMAVYKYNITVRGVTSNCGSREGNESEPLTITPQIPGTPMIFDVCPVYENQTLQIIESTWNEVDIVSVSDDCANGQDIRASYELSYTTNSGALITTCVVDGTNCSNGTCRHQLQNNMVESGCQPTVSQFSGEGVTVSVTATNIVGRSNPAVSRSISGANVYLNISINTTNLTNGSVVCMFLEAGYNCTIAYSTNTNQVYMDTSFTSGRIATITLSQEFTNNAFYNYNVTAESDSQCVRVRGTFRAGGVSVMLSVLHWVVLGVGLPFVMVGIVTITTEGGTSFSISYTRVKITFQQGQSCAREGRDGSGSKDSAKKDKTMWWLIAIAAIFCVIGIAFWIAALVLLFNDPTVVTTVTIVCIVLGLTGIVVAYIFIAAVVGIRIYDQRNKIQEDKKTKRWLIIALLVIAAILCVIAIGLWIVVAVQLYLRCRDADGHSEKSKKIKSRSRTRPDGSEGKVEMKDVSQKKEEEQQYSTLQHPGQTSPDPLLPPDQTYSKLGEHGETGGGDIYNKPIHGGHPHAVPNPVDPNYSHLKEGEATGTGYNRVQRGPPPRAVANPRDPSYCHFPEGASRPPVEALQYDVVGSEPRYKPKTKEEEGKKKGRK